MKIGVPKEIKPQENRIGLTPESVKDLISNGHEVLVEKNGGYEAGFENKQYEDAGVHPRGGRRQSGQGLHPVRR
mgnify:CR=1 FL=1